MDDFNLILIYFLFQMLLKTIFFILFLQLVRGNEDFQRQSGDGETCFTKECIAASHRYVIGPTDLSLLKEFSKNYYCDYSKIMLAQLPINANFMAFLCLVFPIDLLTYSY